MTILAEVFRSHTCELVTITQIEITDDETYLWLSRCDAPDQLHPAPPVASSSRDAEKAAKIMAKGLDSFRDPPKGVRIRQPIRQRQGGGRVRPEYSSGSSQSDRSADDLAAPAAAARPRRPDAA